MNDPIQFIETLLDTARKEDWEKVDNELVPQLRLMDGNIMAEKLLEYVDDKNSNIRDVVATSFAGLEGLNSETEKKVAEKMFAMATADEERFPAGRAMTYLLILRDKPEFRDRVLGALGEFKARAEKMGWTVDLKETIPALTDIFNEIGDS